MRFILSACILVATATSCFKAPDFDPSRNPFLSEFEGSFIKRIEAEPYLEDEDRLIYKISVYPDYNFIPEEVYQIQVNYEPNDSRAADRQRFYIRFAGQVYKQAWFYDDKVEKGKSYTYSFRLVYENEVSQPNEDKFILHIPE